LTVEEVAPFGMVTVRPAGREETVSFPEAVARSVRVSPAEEDEDGRHTVEEEV
jgi:DtxR family Mn-dependent transcriptional regulator